MAGNAPDLASMTHQERAVLLQGVQIEEGALLAIADPTARELVLGANHFAGDKMISANGHLDEKHIFVRASHVEQCKRRLGNLLGGK